MVKIPDAGIICSVSLSSTMLFLRRGGVRFNNEAWCIADKLRLVGPVVEQPPYNLLTRDRVEKEYRWLYAEHGLGLTVFSPLEQGIFTGKYNAC